MPGLMAAADGMAVGPLAGATLPWALPAAD